MLAESGIRKSSSGMLSLWEDWAEYRVMPTTPANVFAKGQDYLRRNHVGNLTGKPAGGKSRVWTLDVGQPEIKAWISGSAEEREFRARNGAWYTWKSD
ncbi:unnamed protein product [Linum trigynum]|uniref:Uncharacterized protein n=1 Tax=Linum trigynum TaxID=586398 RepID=A0AAV2GAT5_9ROSI